MIRIGLTAAACACAGIVFAPALEADASRIAAPADRPPAMAAAPAAQAAPAVAPRVAPVPEAERTPEQRALAERWASAGMANALATFLHYPSLGERILAHMQYLTQESTLAPRHRTLLALRTAWLARSEYLWAHRAAAARLDGFSEAEIRRVAEGAGAAGWDPFEATLLRAADELHLDSFVSDATWQALSTRYDVTQLIDTVDTVGAFTMYAGVINSLGVALEPDARERLPADVPRTLSATRTNLRLVGREPRIPPVESPGGRGGGANVFRTFTRHPPADRVRGAINTHVNSSSTLSPRHRELLLIRIGVLCRSEYEYAAHVRVGRQIGMTDEDIALILEGPARGGDPVDIALLRATDELFHDDVVSAQTWGTLATTFDTRQLFDVLIAVGGYRSTSLLINSAGVQLDANMDDFRFPPELR